MLTTEVSRAWDSHESHSQRVQIQRVRHPETREFLGKAPAKKQRNSKTNSSQPAKNAQAPKALNANGAKCYICNQPDHLANACPSKGKIKAGAQASLYKNKSFMALWQSSFADSEQQKCATKLLKAWGDDDLCPTCMCKISFDDRCDPNDISIAKHTDWLPKPGTTMVVP